MSIHKISLLTCILFLVSCTTSHQQSVIVEDYHSDTSVNPPIPASETMPPLNENKTNTIETKKKASETASEKSAASVTSWNLSGALAAKKGRKGWSASLNWHQQGPSHYLIRLSGPLGGGTVIIEKSGGSVVYKDGPKTITSSSADELLQQQTGIRLPVSNLYYWVRGIPAPGGTPAAKDDANHMILLKQAGYTIYYGGYQTLGNIALPTKIRLEGNGVLIKLVVKKWSV